MATFTGQPKKPEDRFDYSAKELDDLGLSEQEKQLSLALRALKRKEQRVYCWDSHGILLFGVKGCGEDALMTIALKQCEKAKITIQYLDIYKLRNETDAEAEIKRVFRKAQAFPPALIILNQLDTIFLNREETAQEILVMLRREIESLSGQKNCKVFCAGHTSQPWSFDKNFMNAFHPQISLPLPSPGDDSDGPGEDPDDPKPDPDERINFIVKLLKVQLKELTYNMKIGGHNLEDYELEQMVKKARQIHLGTWKDFEGAVYASYTNAMWDTLKLHTHEEISKVHKEWTHVALASIVIKKENLQAALSNMVASVQKADIKKFKPFIKPKERAKTEEVEVKVKHPSSIFDLFCYGCMECCC